MTRVHTVLLLVGLCVFGSAFCYAGEVVVVDNGENIDLLQWWIYGESAIGVDRTIEVAFEGKYSIKMSFDLNNDTVGACFHNHRFQYTEVLKSSGWLLRYRFFNPNQELAGKVTIHSRLYDDKGNWWILPAWGAEAIDVLEDPGTPIGFSGSIDGSVGGDGWYTYEALIPKGQGLKRLDGIQVIQIWLLVDPSIEHDFAIGPNGVGPNYIYVDNIEVVPVEY